jgi:hypothetical protein
MMGSAPENCKGKVKCAGANIDIAVSETTNGFILLTQMAAD